jgi:hypothetical protein
MLDVKFSSLQVGFDKLGYVLDNTEKRIASWEGFWEKDKFWWIVVGGMGFLLGRLDGIVKWMFMGKQVSEC